MTHVRTKDANMHIEGPDDNGHYWLHLSASGEACRIDLGMPRGMVETALLMAASVKFRAAITDAAHVNETPKSEHEETDVLTDYSLAPHLQKIVEGAKTAPQWDMQLDRLAPTDADSKPVWPDFIAPPKYENPDPRWVDPALPDFRLIWKVARECGYAVGLHGSMKRDCDLIAVPWTDEAVLAFDLIDHLCTALNAKVVGPVAGKPHGRLGWNLQVDGYVKVIDISVVPRSQNRAALTTEEK